jgi:undecaprenyl-diphosphatase
MVLLASFGVLLACAVGAGELLALTERPGGSTAFDSSITVWMVNHRAHGLTTLARVFSTLGSQTVLLPVVGIALITLLSRRKLRSAAFLFAAWGGGLLIYVLTKHFVSRPRPPSAIWLTNVGTSTSFPSGHATQSLATLFALALVTGTWLGRTRWTAVGFAIFVAAGVGWSRVYLGVHWATDVLAGWLIAAAWVAIVTWVSGHGRQTARHQADN